MPFQFRNLAEARRFMAEEYEIDVAANTDWQSPRLNDGALGAFRDHLRRACREGTDVTLGQGIRAGGLLRQYENTVKGQKLVPHNAHETLSEGEFNHYYCRALCRHTLDVGGTLTVYRAKEVVSPRPESAARIGTMVQPQALLLDLRTGRRLDQVFNLPQGPNSGLSLHWTP